jgi:hypothetical protein
MSQGNTRLRRENYAIVFIKLLVITGLWWVVADHISENEHAAY